MDPVALFFGQVGIAALAPHPNAALLAANFAMSRDAQAYEAKFGRLPTRPDVATNPPGVLDRITRHKVINVLFDTEEDRNWSRQFTQCAAREPPLIITRIGHEPRTAARERRRALDGRRTWTCLASPPAPARGA